MRLLHYSLANLHLALKYAHQRDNVAGRSIASYPTHAKDQPISMPPLASKNIAVRRMTLSTTCGYLFYQGLLTIKFCSASLRFLYQSSNFHTPGTISHSFSKA